VVPWRKGGKKKNKVEKKRRKGVRRAPFSGGKKAPSGQRKEKKNRKSKKKGRGKFSFQGKEKEGGDVFPEKGRKKKKSQKKKRGPTDSLFLKEGKTSNREKKEETEKGGRGKTAAWPRKDPSPWWEKGERTRSDL